MGVLVIYCKMILREIEDYIIALPSNAIEYKDNELACPLYRPGRYNFSPKSISPSQLSHTIFTIDTLLY